MSVSWGREWAPAVGVSVWPMPAVPDPGAVADHERALAAWLLDCPGTYGLIAVTSARVHAEQIQRRVRRGAAPWTGGRQRWDCCVRTDLDERDRPCWRVYAAYVGQW